MALSPYPDEASSATLKSLDERIAGRALHFLYTLLVERNPGLHSQELLQKHHLQEEATILKTLVFSIQLMRHFEKPPCSTHHTLYECGEVFLSLVFEHSLVQEFKNLSPDLITTLREFLLEKLRGERSSVWFTGHRKEIEYYEALLDAELFPFNLPKLFQEVCVQ